MGLAIGIVGLPNVGKSTTFNALTKEQNAESANYPFCTIEPNKAVVPVPDKRLDKLGELVNPEKFQYATVDFVDIAGLVSGASKGEGMGNQFLSNIKEAEAILHIVRCFEDENVTHVDGSVDPLRDIETIETELILADIQTVENRVERLRKQLKGTDKSVKIKFEIAEELLAHLNENKPAITYENSQEEKLEDLMKELRLLTDKKVIYGANVDEDGLAEDSEYVTAVRKYAAENDAEVIKLCSKIEEEMAGMEDDERDEFLKDLGAEESGLDQIIKKSYEILGLISYFTAGVKEVRAWTIKKGWLAPKSASVIHNDFEKGFIRAEVIGYDDYVECGGESKAKEAGKMRLEGKEYEVQDGDVMHFRFNV
ncbi:MAG: redox-regulated ATPase YchF [Campylobacterales bacterium]|nr:redox-regulated ATPase YchF [Campylobacterales bacterium]